MNTKSRTEVAIIPDRSAPIKQYKDKVSVVKLNKSVR